jgi:hypothetical protein
MSVVVFRGPTVTAAEVHAVLPDAQCRPPAGQGDVHRAVLAGATVVALIDGTFERGPAVWHKEILDALARGVTVLGAASMGALRAVECGAYGMRAVGRIAAAYADGSLTDDDEVTVAHLDAEHDWRCVSEALVNTRATLAEAVTEEIIDADTAADLIALAKQAFYAERSWPRLFADATAAGVDTNALRAWLPGHRVDAKHRDAQELLTVVAHGIPAATAPPWRLEPSRMWQRAAAAMAAEPSGGDDTALDAVLDRLRLDDAYYELHQAALLRHLAVADARRNGVDPDPAQAVTELRDAFGLTTADDVAAWCTANRLDPEGLRRLATDQARLTWAYQRHGDAARTSLADQLRIRGLFPTAAPEARPPVGADDEEQAWQWYARTRAVESRGWPDPRRGADEQAALAARLGFDTPDDLRHAVLDAYRSAGR